MCVDEAKDTPLPCDVPWDMRKARGSGCGWCLMPDGVSRPEINCCPDAVHVYSCCKRVTAVSHYLNSHQNSHFHTKMFFIFLVVLKQTMSYLENWSLSHLFSWGQLRQVSPHSPCVCVWGGCWQRESNPPRLPGRTGARWLSWASYSHPLQTCPESQLHSGSVFSLQRAKRMLEK